MKIKQIAISGFKKVEQLTFEPGKINVLVGANGSGKSSTLEAIRYGLTGDYPADPIMGGKEQAIVKLEIPDIGTVTRKHNRVKNEVRLNGKITSQVSLEQLLTEAFGVSAKMADIMTSMTVAGMSKGDLSTFFLKEGQIPINISFQKLETFCNLSDKAKTELALHLPNKDIQIEDIEASLNYYKNRRKDLKKERDLLKARAGFHGQKPKQGMNAIDKKLLELSQKLGAIQTQRDTYQQITQRRASILDDIQKSEEMLGPDVSRPSQVEVDKITNEQREVEAARKEAQRLLDKVTENGIRLKKVLGELAKPTCPISPKLKCSTNKTVLREELTLSIERERQEYLLQKGRLDSLCRQMEHLMAQQQQMAQVEAQYQRRELLQQKILSLKNTLPPEPDIPPDEETEILLKKDLDTLQAEKAEMSRYEEAMRSQILVNEKEELLKIIDEIVKELDPKKGIRQKIMEYALSPLESYFNERLKNLLPKYQAKLDCSNGFTIHLVDQELGIDALESASEGERSQIYFVLLDLFNALSTYRILIFDNTDHLDTEAFISLLKLVQSDEVQQNYDHIFFSAIDRPEWLEYLAHQKDIHTLHFPLTLQKKAVA